MADCNQHFWFLKTHVYPYLGLYTIITLAQVSHAHREAVMSSSLTRNAPNGSSSPIRESPTSSFGEGFKQICIARTPKIRAKIAARSNNFDICKLVYSWSIANKATFDDRTMLVIAIRNGYLELALKLYQFFKTTNIRPYIGPSTTLCAAARGGQYELCTRIYEAGWSLDDPTGTLGDDGIRKIIYQDRSEIMYSAARGGHLNICCLVDRWVSQYVKENEIYPSLSYLQIDVCYRAMLYGAARGGYRDLCIYAHDRWLETQESVLVYDIAGANAIRSGSLELCELIHAWKLTEEGRHGLYYSQEVAAARNGSPEIYALVMRWITEAHEKSTNSMSLLAAARGGHAKLCRIICQAAIKQGSLPLKVMLEGAIQEGHYDLCLLARQWMRDPFLLINPRADCPNDQFVSRDELDECSLYFEINYKDMYQDGKALGRPDICALAVEWAREDGFPST